MRPWDMVQARTADQNGMSATAYHCWAMAAMTCASAPKHRTRSVSICTIQFTAHQAARASDGPRGDRRIDRAEDVWGHPLKGGAGKTEARGRRGRETRERNKKSGRGGWGGGGGGRWYQIAAHRASIALCGLRIHLSPTPRSLPSAGRYAVFPTPPTALTEPAAHGQLRSRLIVGSAVQPNHPSDEGGLIPQKPLAPCAFAH